MPKGPLGQKRPADTVAAAIMVARERLTTAVVDATGAHPLPQRPLPPEMLGLVQHAKAYEQLAVKAACSGSRDDVVRALLANPLVGQYPLAADLADALLTANRRYLPRFFAD